MGTDPRRSVTDPVRTRLGPPQPAGGRRLAHVTNGGVNPVLTIFANAYRIMHEWVGSGEPYA